MVVRKKNYMSQNKSSIFMFVYTIVLYEYMNTLRNDVYNLFVCMFKLKFIWSFIAVLFIQRMKDIMLECEKKLSYMNIHIIMLYNLSYMNIHIIMLYNLSYMNIHIIMLNKPSYTNIHIITLNKHIHIIISNKLSYMNIENNVKQTIIHEYS